jgi:hypothetical protein
VPPPRCELTAPHVVIVRVPSAPRTIPIMHQTPPGPPDRPLPRPGSQGRHPSFPTDRPLRLRCISCEVLARPVYRAAAGSPHLVDVSMLRIGLHNTPPDLRSRLQVEIDAAGPEYDAVVLAYGLCGSATAGITAGSVPLVLPRAHDCVTIFLGSRDRYADEFTAHPGTYWYATDYIERRDPADPNGMLGVGATSEADMAAARATYVEQYGEDNADYIMEVMGAWQAHYDRAAYVEMGVADSPAVEAQARDEAERRGWTFERMLGNDALVRRLIEADWDDDFLVLQPGERLTMTYDDAIIGVDPT